MKLYFRYRFTYISIGTPGRCHDSFIFQNSALKKIHEKSVLLRKYSRNINGVSVPVLLLGDSAFQLSTFVMKPYPETIEMSARQRKFNTRLSKCRRLVENAFGHLKARFRKVGRGLEIDIDNVQIVIKSCCVLHNYLNEENDNVWIQWLEELKTNTKNEQPHRYTTAGDNNYSGTTIRDALAEHFDSNNN